MHRALSILLVIAFAGTAWADPLEQGLAAYDRGAWEEAAGLLKPLAEGGNVQAQQKLGRLYERGKGVARDYVAAEKWYRKAAVRGDAAAEARLAFMLRLGIGVKRDYDEALKWYKASAAQGNPLAQVDLGYMMMEGVAMPADYSAAADLFSKSAKQGNALAMSGLGALYESGKGVPKDLVQAWVWYARATVDDGEYEPDVFERATRSRDEVAKKLTPGQIEQAKKIAASKP